MSVEWTEETSGALCGRTAARSFLGRAWSSGSAYLNWHLNLDGFPDKEFATQAEAKEYIEACYVLWLAANG